MRSSHPYAISDGFLNECEGILAVQAQHLHMRSGGKEDHLDDLHTGCLGACIERTVQPKKLWVIPGIPH